MINLYCIVVIIIDKNINLIKNILYFFIIIINYKLNYINIILVIESLKLDNIK